MVLVPAQPSHGADAHFENVTNTPGSRFVACHLFRTTEPVKCGWKPLSLLSAVRMTASCKVGKARGKKGGAGVLPLTLSRQLMPSRERRGPL